MTFLYIDTNGLVKGYVAGAGSDEVSAVTAGADPVVTSLVTSTEVSAEVAKTVLLRVLYDDGGRRAHRRLLGEWPDSGSKPITGALVARADTLAWNHGLRAYDAMQVATALACRETIATLGAHALFATFNHQLRDATLAVGLDTWPQ
ncbi:MAG: type II toxin-antitoxin system VapC family toxin [Rhodococcus sp.]|nr:type II toxin-antitoxin system VapC family toxin [Rhodococcus sp. (in: high G+C Gram-positive bacteria)]